MAVGRQVLIVGGARSGKSRLAQGFADASGLSKVLIATAQALDGEMEERIARHRAERAGGAWRVREEPRALAEALMKECARDRVVVVDCLTLWLSNLLLAGIDADDASLRLAASLAAAPGPVLLVSNEVGCGVVPATSLGRRFRDEQGRLNQRIAAACDTVIAVTAGCPIIVKPAPAVDFTLA
jgi:adenosylcobinamide kinase/adenosylcobinamide-phosphate guanylyltransferase